MTNRVPREENTLYYYTVIETMSSSSLFKGKRDPFSVSKSVYRNDLKNKDTLVEKDVSLLERITGSHVC